VGTRNEHNGVSMSADQLTTLRALRDATTDPAQRAALDAAILALNGAISKGVDLSSATMGDVTAGNIIGGDMHQNTLGNVALSDDARLKGVAVGVNLGTIVYGRDPSEEERSRLAWYLERLVGKLSRLPLRGLEERLDHGDGVALAQIYVQLATESDVLVAQGAASELSSYIDPNRDTYPRSWIRQDYHPDFQIPGHSIRLIQTVESSPNLYQETGYVLLRPLLATEAVYQRPRIVLLGDPGGGKSTFLRHLAWAIARRGLDQTDATSDVLGWPPDHRVLPIILPLRTLASKLAVTGDATITTVFAALRDEMHACGMQQVDDLLSAALASGNALLLLDGLDEVPLDAQPGQTVSRHATLDAIRAFVQLHAQAQVVLTCRTRAFDDGSRTALGWPVELLAPFTLGQVRNFVCAWFGELVAKQQITPEQAERLISTLIDTIVASPRLTAMAQTPLLLTMMALVLFNKGELPRDRPQLYERILELLLGNWDQVRGGQNLAQAVGLPDWGSERFQPLLDQLSYEAHKQATSQDGRGQLDRSMLRDALIAYFERAAVPDAWGTAKRCLDYFEQRSGVLAPDGSDSYVFAHLTLQEHCAGRHIALNSEDPVALILHYRADDRWREPIFLGAGLLRPAELQNLLSDLIDREESGAAKAVVRWYRDLVLAAEIGKDRDWNYLRTRPMLKVERLQRDLRAGFVALLGDKAQPLPVAERVRAGFLLGELGDPRFPVTTAQWQQELQRALAGDTSGYFCRVDAGEYIIGSSDDDPDAKDSEKPQHRVRIEQPFLIARYPITNIQWQAWVAAGGKSSRYANDDDLNRPNQPIVGVNWDIANNFAEWLSALLGVTVRLPSEYEREAAARGGDARRYPWGNDWCEDYAATRENEQARSNEGSAPVGCFPAGAAPCGALDMAGNVWEWTSDIWDSYPGATKPFTEKKRRTQRGGSYHEDRANVRCGARVRPYLTYDYSDFGCRIVVAPPLAQ
jgi:formylglycine-generating enzyme required for sulfatase activity